MVGGIPITGNIRYTNLTSSNGGVNSLSEDAGFIPNI